MFLEKVYKFVIITKLNKIINKNKKIIEQKKQKNFVV